jgi:hypothetical protein
MARAGKHFFVLIFCYFLIKQKVVALRGNERTNAHKSTTYRGLLRTLTAMTRVKRHCMRDVEINSA